MLAIISLSISLESKINIFPSNEKQNLCQEIFKKMTEEHFFNYKDLSSIENYQGLIIHEDALNDKSLKDLIKNDNISKILFSWCN